MTVIQNHNLLHRPISEVFAFLADCNNHEQLMPENIYNWSSTQDEASFTIQNMAKLALKVDQRLENEEVRFVPAEKAPFDVRMRWTLEAAGEGETRAALFIEADLNMMLKMIASGPLQKLVDHQINRLKEVLEK